LLGGWATAIVANVHWWNYVCYTWIWLCCCTEPSVFDTRNPRCFRSFSRAFRSRQRAIPNLPLHSVSFQASLTQPANPFLPTGVSKANRPKPCTDPTADILNSLVHELPLHLPSAYLRGGYPACRNPSDLRAVSPDLEARYALWDRVWCNWAK